MTISIKIIEFGEIYIYINNILHLYIRKAEEIQGLHSYVEVDDKSYFIELNLTSGKIIIEYDSLEKWQKVLNALEKVIKKDWGFFEDVEIKSQQS